MTNRTGNSVQGYRWFGDLESPLLRWGLRIVGVAFIAYSFAAMPLLAMTPLGDEHGSTMGHLVSWGSSGLEYQVMLCAVNIGMGIYLALSGNDPVKYRYVIDVFLVSQSLHMVSMFAMGFISPAHRMHLIGDVPVATLSVVVVALVWLPVRKKASTAAGRDCRREHLEVA
ncbi:hypothetical protein [Mycobacteroides sp. LB1]|uniref:hypothetical protein n=1 Tax=Mycobacteroides sp. LB1 TaxID=2750814 RepID=UPI0015DECBEC|nr:hypothetical protein [Mycobacteroides sp. LB1]